MIKIISVLAVFCVLNNLSFASESWIQSGEEQTNIIELYTSEGCSSCPPADAWLSQLKKQEGFGKSFIPLGFHVDFWDYLGWKDPGSSHEFTLRESKLAKTWGSDSIYTPAFAWNGIEFRSWRKGLPKTNQKKVGRLRVEKNWNQYTVEFFPAAGLKKPSSNWVFNAAKIEMGVKSNPTSGENKGEKFSHDFLVRDLFSKKSNQFDSAKVVFSIADVKEIVFWVERDDELRPIQAVGTLK